MQDGKVEILQTLSQQSPLETILENTRLSSFDLIFSKIIIFLKFHLREALKPPKNMLDTLASSMETETNTMTFLILNNFMILPFYLKVVTISKDFNLSIPLSNKPTPSNKSPLFRGRKLISPPPPSPLLSSTRFPSYL